MRRERAAPAPPEVIAARSRYIAPEQTGRMNRSLDRAANLYGLGVSAVRDVDRQPPVLSVRPDGMDPLPHRAAAGAARRAAEGGARRHLDYHREATRQDGQDRYQTAAGLEHDLRRCLAAWEAQRRIDDFPLGEHDTPDRLLIPEKLYGREREIETLLAAFERVVTSGTPVLVLVSGYPASASPPSSTRCTRCLVPPRGLFASASFDQYKRDILIRPWRKPFRA